MIRQAVATLACTVAFLVVGVVPASAKLPRFEVDVTVSGGEALIRVWFPSQNLTLLDVRVWFQSQDSMLSDGIPQAGLDGLLAVYPAGDLDDRGRPVVHGNSLPVDLGWVDGRGWYQGRVEVDGPGSWVVVPFPTASFDPEYASHHEYPANVGFVVVDPSNRPLLLGGASLLGIWAMWLFGSRHRRSSGLGR